jgi:hypothetical protein
MYNLMACLLSIDMGGIRLRFLPRLEVLPGPVDVAFGISDLHIVSFQDSFTQASPYHISLEIILFLLLEPFQILQHTGTRILDILL